MKIKLLGISLFLVLISLTISSCQVELADYLISPSANPSQSPIVDNTDVSSDISNSVSSALGQMEFRKVISGDISNIKTFDTRVITSEQEFQDLWADHTGSFTNPLFLPQIDFELKNLIAIFLGNRATSGFTVYIDEITEDSNKITVKIREIEPVLGEQVKAELSQPYLIVETPKFTKAVEFKTPGTLNAYNEKISFNIIESGSDSGIKELRHQIAKNEQDFSTLYKEHIISKNKVESGSFPSVDFDKNIAGAIFLGKRSGGEFSVEINEILRTDNQVIVRASEVIHSNSQSNNDISSPYLFFSIPDFNLPVKFEINVIVNKDNNSISIDSEELNPQLLQNGDHSRIVNPDYSLINNNNELGKLWFRHTGNQSINPPNINFAEYSLLAVFIGQKDSNGYNINLTNVIKRQDELRVIVEINRNRSGFSSISTSPYKLMLIPKVNKTASFIINNRVND